jgi:hypothetical protein
VVECLLCKREALSSNPHPTKKGKKKKGISPGLGIVSSAKEAEKGEGRIESSR